MDEFTLLVPLNLSSNDNSFAREVSEQLYHTLCFKYPLTEPLYEFVDMTEDLKNQYETGTVRAWVNLQTGKCAPHDDPAFSKFVECDDGVVREKVNPDEYNGRTFLSPAAKQLRLEDVSLKKIFKSFKAFADSCVDYNKEHKAWGEVQLTENPFILNFEQNQTQGFLIPENLEQYPMCGDDTNVRPEAPAGYKWTPAAKIKDIAFDKMAEIMNIDKDYLLASMFDYFLDSSMPEGDDYPIWTKDQEQEIDMDFSERIVKILSDAFTPDAVLVDVLCDNFIPF